jgi:hypothetical protein
MDNSDNLATPPQQASVEREHPVANNIRLQDQVSGARGASRPVLYRHYEPGGRRLVEFGGRFSGDERDGRNRQ